MVNININIMTGKSGVSAQWRVGGHLINSDKEDVADLPSRGWLYEDSDGEWQNDETLTIKSTLINFNFISYLIMKEASYQSTLTLCLRGLL